MTYTKYPSGSEWRKWDLHIHTPETKKNDQFLGATSEEKWELYIDDINKSTEEISVVGVTDYFSIDNYFKFKKAIGNKLITKQFDLVLPNVELRVLPVTGSATPINLHCIFNCEIDAEITTRFLSKLKFKFGDSNYSAQPDELKRLGRALPGKSGLNDEAALRVGVSQYVIEVGTLREIFDNDKILRDNTIIVVSNRSTDGVTGATQHADFFIQTGQSQLDATRWSIYQFSDAIFSSNEKDILYFTGGGVDSKEIVIEKSKTLMPCFHGCDAHENQKIFKPDNNKYCWIKADPTFEGLRQTLYEPQDRVKIQAFKPDLKNDRFTISQLEFIDRNSLFGNQKVLLNSNLNAIIGGKSSGKSLLLYCAAKSIDPEQVDRTSKRLKFDGYNLDGKFNFKVTWKNGESDVLNDAIRANKNHKITYIPQLYINHLVEKNNKEELNDLIESILLQDSTFKEFYELKKQDIENATVEIDGLLTNYLQTRQKLIDVQKKSKEIGKSKSINDGIEALKKAILAGQKASNLSESEFKIYNDFLDEKSKTEKLLKSLRQKELALAKIVNEISSSKNDLLGDTNQIDPMRLRGKIDRILDEFNTIPDDINTLVEQLHLDFEHLIKNFNGGIAKIDIAKQRTVLHIALSGLNEKLRPFLEKIAGQQELQKLTTQVQSEQAKFEQAVLLEKQFATLLNDYTNIRNKSVTVLNKRFKVYKEIGTKINDTRKDIGPGISLSCNLVFKQEDLALFEQTNKASITVSNVFNKVFKDNVVQYEELLKLYNQPLRVIENRLLIDADGKQDIPLKVRLTIDEVLRGMINDGFKFDYTVSYKGDDLLSMSPGKKGTVLLILFLQISSSEYPIFIDQPEDNLDNRTIYELLCQMIKVRKKDRQIVIVSHNANLVIATDSENIIVANQEGQDNNATTLRNRFEYVNGSLECSFPKDETVASILYQQGIKEHSCDILEGGDEAFKQRERKYSIK